MLLFCMSFAFFTLTRLTPGPPFSTGENPRAHQELIDKRMHALGLDKPWYAQYPAYLDALVHGNLGDSYVYNQPVSKLLSERVPNSVLLQDYVGTAKAKGLSKRTVNYKHALRNAILPSVTLVALQTPQFVSGAIITEGIFSWPGMGLLAFQAAVDRDYPVILGVVMLVAVLTVLFNLLADIAYAVVDPRIRY